MSGQDEAGTRWAAQVVIEFDRSLFRHVGVAQWNGFVGELVRRGLTPVAWSKGEHPPPVGVMFDFRGLRVPHRRLDGIDFTFCDLDGADFERADFEGSSLKNAKLGDCRGANLRGTRLQGAEFRGDVSGCDMSGAMTEGTDFTHAYCSEGEPPLGLPPEALAAIRRVPKEEGDGGPEAPFEQPLRARVTIHEVPW